MGFPILTPKGNKYLPYKKEMTFSEKKNEVEKVLEFFDKHILQNPNSLVIRRMLYNLGSYLLQGEKPDINSHKKAKSIQRREIPLSNVINSNYENLFYSDTHDDENDLFINLEISVDQHFVDYSEQLISELYQYKKPNYQDKKWQQTRTHKLNMLRSCDEKYKEITDTRVISYKLDETPPTLEKYENVKRVLVHKARKGIIDNDTNYISGYIYVDKTNVFIFNNQKFKIDESVENYQTIDEKSKMDSVICYYILDTDTYYFFDEEVNNISKFVYPVDT